jgi:hypothetical protein
VLLWSLLLFNTSNWVITWVALIVIAIGAVKVIRNLSLFLGDAGSWINKLKSGFALQTALSIAKIRTYSQDSDPDAFRTPASTLHMYEVLFRYMAEQKEKLVKCSVIAAILITIPFYLYLSFIFTSIYLGVARLNHITWSWTDALTTSIFIPFAFTDLPHNVWIRTIGGLQAVVVTILGYTVLFRRIQHSVNQISQAATELYVPLNDEGLKSTVALLNVIKIKPTTESAPVS